MRAQRVSLNWNENSMHFICDKERKTMEPIYRPIKPGNWDEVTQIDRLEQLGEIVDGGNRYRFNGGIIEYTRLDGRGSQIVCDRTGRCNRMVIQRNEAKKFKECIFIRNMFEIDEAIRNISGKVLVIMGFDQEGKRCKRTDYSVDRILKESLVVRDEENGKAYRVPRTRAIREICEGRVRVKGIRVANGSLSPDCNGRDSIAIRDKTGNFSILTGASIDDGMSIATYILGNNSKVGEKFKGVSDLRKDIEISEKVLRGDNKDVIIEYQEETLDDEKFGRGVIPYYVTPVVLRGDRVGKLEIRGLRKSLIGKLSSSGGRIGRIVIDDCKETIAESIIRASSVGELCIYNSDIICSSSTEVSRSQLNIIDIKNSKIDIGTPVVLSGLNTDEIKIEDSTLKIDIVRVLESVKTSNLVLSNVGINKEGLWELTLTGCTIDNMELHNVNQVLGREKGVKIKLADCKIGRLTIDKKSGEGLIVENKLSSIDTLIIEECHSYEDAVIASKSNKAIIKNIDKESLNCIKKLSPEKRVVEVRNIDKLLDRMEVTSDSIGGYENVVIVQR